MLKGKKEIVMFVEVVNGNPNGNPDLDNQPRTDIETGMGIISDVCIKRKIRNYVNIVKEGEPGYGILIQSDKSLNAKFTEAYDACELEKGKKGKDENAVNIARDYICKNFFDVRVFGAVMSTGNDQCGTVRGPVQFTFGESLSPISIQPVTITRQARTTDERQETGNTEIGHKYIVPYGLYRIEGFISAALANRTTDMTEEDFNLLCEAILNMYEFDRSAARGKMCVRKMFVFEHESVLGNAPSQLLFDKIKAEAKTDLPRKFEDYEFTIDRTMPEGVTMKELC